MVVCSTGAASELVASAKRLAATEQMEYFPGSYRFCFRFCVFVCGLRIVGKKKCRLFFNFMDWKAHERRSPYTRPWESTRQSVRKVHADLTVLT